jgi:hypothetical protein
LPEDDLIIAIIEDGIEHWLQVMLPEHLLLLSSEILKHFDASLSITFFDFLY